MSLQRTLTALAGASLLAFVLSGQAQARRLHDEDLCAPGQHKNVITAICEGPANSYIFASPGYGYWDGGYRHHRWWRHHMRHHH